MLTFYTNQCFYGVWYENTGQEWANMSFPGYNKSSKILPPVKNDLFKGIYFYVVSEIDLWSVGYTKLALILSSNDIETRAPRDALRMTLFWKTAQNLFPGAFFNRCALGMH